MSCVLALAWHSVMATLSTRWFLIMSSVSSISSLICNSLISFSFLFLSPLCCLISLSSCLSFLSSLSLPTLLCFHHTTPNLSHLAVWVYIPICHPLLSFFYLPPSLLPHSVTQISSISSSILNPNPHPLLCLSLSLFLISTRLSAISSLPSHIYS